MARSPSATHDPSRTLIIIASTREEHANQDFRVDGGLSEHRFRYFAALVAQIFGEAGESHTTRTSIPITRTAEVVWHLGKDQLIKQISDAAREFTSHVELEDQVLRWSAERGKSEIHYRSLMVPRESLGIPRWASGPETWTTPLSVEYGCLSHSDLMGNLEDRKSVIDLIAIIATLLASVQASIIGTYVGVSRTAVKLTAASIVACAICAVSSGWASSRTVYIKQSRYETPDYENEVTFSSNPEGIALEAKHCLLPPNSSKVHSRSPASTPTTPVPTPSSPPKNPSSPPPIKNATPQMIPGMPPLGKNSFAMSVLDSLPRERNKLTEPPISPDARTFILRHHSSDPVRNNHRMDGLGDLHEWESGESEE
ncbi:hypothetical protein P7C70_g7385, partial [Phenoliferia sp. Uapishka_3]